MEQNVNRGAQAPPQPNAGAGSGQPQTPSGGGYQIQQSPEGSVFYTEKGLPVPGQGRPPTR